MRFSAIVRCSSYAAWFTFALVNAFLAIADGRCGWAAACGFSCAVFGFYWWLIAGPVREADKLTEEMFAALPDHLRYDAEGRAR